MSRDKPLWLGRGIKTATFQRCSFLKACMSLIKLWWGTPKPRNQIVIWHSKAPKCWLQILSKWAVISHSDWGEASKLQHFRGALFEDLHLPNQAAIWHSKVPKCWLQILSKWAVISHSDWGEASKLQHFRGALFEDFWSCDMHMWLQILSKLSH